MNADPGAPDRTGRVLGEWLAFVALACAAYATVLDSFFVSDDFVVLHGVVGSGPFGVWSGGHSVAAWGNFLRPAISLSFWADHALWGLRPFGYHLTNALFHGSNAFLVARIGRALLPGRVAVARLGGLFFLVMPAHGESVSWIAGRTDVIATAFGLAAFLFYLRAATSPRRRDSLLALLCFALALSAKESLLCLPLVVCAHRLFMHGRQRGRGLWLALAMLGCLVPYFLVRRILLGAWLGGYADKMQLQHDPGFLFDNVLRYLVHLVGFGAASDGRWLTLGCAIALAALLAATFVGWLRDRSADEAPPSRPLLFLVAATFLSLLPALNLPISQPGTEGERFLYTSSAWFALLLAAIAAPARARPRRLVLAVGLVLTSAALLVTRNARWREAGALSRGVIDRLAQLPAAAEPTTIYILNLPDDLQDAFILRNGLGEALRLFAHEPPSLAIVAYQPLVTPRDAATVERHGDAVRLTLGDDEGALEYWSASDFASLYALQDPTPHRFDVRLLAKARALVLAFDRGALRVID